MFGAPTPGPDQMGITSDFGLGDSIRRATTRPQRPTPLGGPTNVQSPQDRVRSALSRVPPGLARQGVTNFTPGQGNPFGGARRSDQIPLPTTVGGMPTPQGMPAPQATPQGTPAPQAQPQAFGNPLFSFLFGGR